MKRYYAFVLLGLLPVIGLTQQKSAVTDTTIYVRVDVPAAYPGGTAAFSKFIAGHLSYPDRGKTNIKGDLNISFIIEKDGSLSDCKVLQGFSPAVNNAFINAIKLAPKWKPAKMRGHVVRQQYFLSMDYENTEAETAAPGKSPTVSANYPGGINDFYSYLGNNIKYPAKAKGLQGKVSASFTIEPEGTLTDVKIEKPILPEIDAELLRLIRESKKWQPAKQNGHGIRQKFIVTIPVQL